MSKDKAASQQNSSNDSAPQAQENNSIRTIVIETIPHELQRYNTVGDWYFEKASPGMLHIRVSDTGNWQWNLALALHEFVEAALCTSAGVTAQAVDAFDTYWKPHTGSSAEEPGDDVRAPYHKQHRVASGTEISFFDDFYSTISEATEKWKSYEATLDRLTEEYDERRKK